MTEHQTPFPYEELSRHHTLSDIRLNTNAADDQIWSVIEHHDGNGCTYGPSHHWFNRLYYIVTSEVHDGDTYYEERWEMDNEDDNQEEDGDDQ